MTDFDRRVKMRAIIEDPIWDHRIDVGLDCDPVDECFTDQLIRDDVVDRLAHLEREDTDNPIAQTMQVRPALELTFDVAAVTATFTQEEK